MLVDAHCHLQFSQFDADRHDCLLRAREQGVTQCLVVGTNRQTSEQALTLAEQHESIYCSLGIHPHDVAQASEADLDWIRQNLRHPKVKAVGECGLDYHYPQYDTKLQQHFLRRQIDIAIKSKLPFIIHNRQSTTDLLSILQELQPAAGYRGHWHCFDETWDVAQQALAMGLHIGFTGIITYKKNDGLRQVATQVPPDRILLETDSPYLPPVPFRGQRNEPGHIVWVAHKIAELRSIPVEELGTLTTNNARGLYSI